MIAAQIVEILLEPDAPNASSIVEASVHPAHRGKVWRASFRDEGRQRWRSTGTTDRKVALVLAKQWEEEARRKPCAGPRPP
jgi:Sigma-70, region 4